MCLDWFEKIQGIIEMSVDHFKSGEAVRLFSRRGSNNTIEYLYNSRVLLRVKDPVDLLEAEYVLYKKWLKIEFNLSDIEIKGEALKQEPHGFTCIHGTRDAMERFIMLATKPVHLFQLGNRMDLEDRLRKQFQLTEEPDFRGIIRLNFIYDKLDVSVSDYVLLIQEKENRLTIPGGKRHLGERSIDCAKRELFEETGIECEITDNAVYNEECRANYFLITII